MVLGLRWREVQNLGQRMRRLERRNYSFQFGAKLKGVERLGIARGEISNPPGFLQPGVFGADAWIVEPGRDRMSFLDLPVGVHQQIGAVAMQHAGPAAGERGGVLFVEAKTRRLDAINLHGLIVEEGMKKADGVGAAPYTGKQRIRQ